VAKRGHMWTQDESGRVHTPLEPVVLAATLALIPVLILDTDATSDGWKRVAEVSNWVIWAIFVVELGAVLVVAPRKKAALRAHWLDVAIVVLTIPLLGQALAWLRLARFIRLARFGVVVARALQAEKRLTSGDSLRIAALLTLAAIVVGGAAQSTVSTGEFGSMWDGIWWASVDRPGPTRRDGADVRRNRVPIHPHSVDCLAVRQGRARRGARGDHGCTSAASGRRGRVEAGEAAGVSSITPVRSQSQGSGPNVHLPARERRRDAR
jgi:hypothetical protein